jgi:hypothetical protein
VLQSVKNELVVLQNPDKLNILIHERRVLATDLAAKWLLSRAVQTAESRADVLRNQNKERGLRCKGAGIHSAGSDGQPNAQGIGSFASGVLRFNGRELMVGETSPFH